MGPHSDECGIVATSSVGVSRIPTLQWGRTLMSAESNRFDQNVNTSRLSFNGAAL